MFAVVLAVLNGTVDAGATFTNFPDGQGDSAWTQYLKSKEDQKRIRVVFVSEPITGDTLATSKKFLAAHGPIVEKTVNLLIAMGKDPAGKKILQDLYRMDSLVPAKTEEFEAIRKAAKVLKID